MPSTLYSIAAVGCGLIIATLLLNFWFTSHAPDTDVRKPRRRINRTEVLTQPVELTTEATPTNTPTLHLIKQPTFTYNCPKLEQTVVICLMNFILSSSENFELRQTIRKTAGSLTYVNNLYMKHIFVVAKSSEEIVNRKIVDESENFRDILFINYVDSYREIMCKSHAILQWSSENVPSHYFISKSDDDVRISGLTLSNHITRIINVNMTAPMESQILSESLRVAMDKFPILCGHTLVKNAIPCRDEGSPYYLSFEEYKDNIFPTYCNGAMYVMSVPMTKRLLSVIRTDEINRMEDVWVTGILRSKLGNGDKNIVKIKPAFAFHIPDLSMLQIQAEALKFHQSQLAKLKEYNISYGC
ncbi:beta-1,3-galactosyltransferase 1-like [Ciona intestinalis]